MKDRLNFTDFVTLCQNRGKIGLSDEEKQTVRESRKALKDIIKANPDKAYYGINTGVGALLRKPIPKRRLREFQENLIMSHACGVGKPLEKEIVRGMMLHMILNLKKGYSGIKLETLEGLVAMFNKDIIPVVPEKGSLGASGDLVPQAHIALALIGKGKVWYRDTALLSERVLRSFGICPVELETGEAIALLNGTSLMTSLLAFLVFQANNLVRTADIAAAMSISALEGDLRSFDARVQKLRPHLGQAVAAFRIGTLLKDENQNEDSEFMQDAYSLRCVPQVHGAFLETLFKVRDIIDEEINAFCGNPIILSKEKKVDLIQGSGNFHGQSLSQAADNLSIALCSLSNISERRIERLLNPHLSGLPPFLTKNGGLNTGLMIAQYTAASLVSENKTLAHPASVDSISVSAGQEDFVSMGAWATRKAWEVCKNAEQVIAIETLCAAQALDFKSPLPESKIKKIHGIVRSYVPYLERDRILAEDIETLFKVIHSGEFLREVENKARS